MRTFTMRTRTTLVSLAFGGLLLAVPAIAAAHAPLTASSPKAGENLDTAPTQVVLTFKGELDPDGSSFTVTDADGTTMATGAVDLTVADRNVMTADVAITEPGAYTVSYVSKSIDGAVLEGTFSFGYRSDAKIPPATGGDDDDHGPDTALSSSASTASQILIGVLLLVSGVTLGARRLLR
jgi:methionine-rich copper-binding protein CopC